MTTESRELCKQVYEATGWPQELNISQLYEYWDDHDELCVISIEDSDDELVPSYTSDYLLEKLPERILIDKQYRRWLSMDNLGSDGWQFSYRAERTAPIYASVADTPLKSLLLLTLKLHEEKLL